MGNKVKFILRILEKKIPAGSVKGSGSGSETNCKDPDPKKDHSGFKTLLKTRALFSRNMQNQSRKTH
jgi:hypothetical protein